MDDDDFEDYIKFLLDAKGVFMYDWNQVDFESEIKGEHFYHAVTLVGYDTTLLGQKYFFVMDSYGANCRNRGYFKAHETSITYGMYLSDFRQLMYDLKLERN